MSAWFQRERAYVKEMVTDGRRMFKEFQIFQAYADKTNDKDFADKMDLALVTAKYLMDSKRPVPRSERERMKTLHSNLKTCRHHVYEYIKFDLETRQPKKEAQNEVPVEQKVVASARKAVLAPIKKAVVAPIKKPVVVRIKKEIEVITLSDSDSE